MDTILGNVHSIETFGALDGPGIRYVIFLQGCPLRCIYCHNADTWTFEKNKLISPQEALEDILRYHSFIENGGVTISGGEPMLQAKFCKQLIDLCHTEGIHCAIDTSGGVPLEKCGQAVDAADMLLLDIKALDKSLAKKITGRERLYFKEILDYCEKTKKDVWIRHVIVPDLTLKKELLEELAEFLKKYKCVKKVELLPFHKLGEYKWRELGNKSPLSEQRVPTNKEIELANNIFKSRGFVV